MKHGPVLGRIRTRIMQVLWDKKQATAQEITDTINHLEPVAHSTIQSHLRALETQGVVNHSLDDRTFIYYPVFTKEQVTTTKTQELIDLLFAGSAQSLVAYLAKKRYVSPEEMKKTLDIINSDDD